MNQFDQHVEHCIERIRQTMQVKAKEYRRNNNPFHNFDRAAAMYDILPEVALTGMMAKHQVSILDIVDDIEAGKIPGFDLVAEKISDNINYLILLEGLINRRRNADICFKQANKKEHVPSIAFDSEGVVRKAKLTLSNEELGRDEE